MKIKNKYYILPITTIIVIIIFILLNQLFNFFTLTKAPILTETATDNNNTNKAIIILDSISEIQKVKQLVIKNGRKPFYTAEEENGDIITVSLRESFPDDPHTSRIATFNINLQNNNITVLDIVTNNNISLDEWKKTVIND